MSSRTAAWNTTVARKVVMGASGLSMVAFAAAHLAGNLSLLVPDGGRAFNEYTELLNSLGELKYLAEIGLVVLFGAHIVTGLRVAAENRSARPRGYEVQGDAGGVSRKSKASLNMIRTGGVLLLFLLLHILSFRFGPEWSVSTAKTSQLQAMAALKPEARDLAGLVITRFKNPLYSLFYVFCMGVLAAHLRHGFWSGFQSLGAMAPRFERPIRAAGIVLALALAVGFLLLPLWVLVDPFGWYTELVRR